MNKAMDKAAKRRYARSLSSCELQFAIRDCMDAAEAEAGWNPAGDAYYNWEASVYRKEAAERGFRCAVRRAVRAANRMSRRYGSRLPAVLRDWASVELVTFTASERDVVVDRALRAAGVM